MAFTVTRILAPRTGLHGRISVTTGFGVNWQLVLDTAIWPLLAAPPDATGSEYPIAFIRAGNNVPLTLIGTYQFPPGWRAFGSRYRVTGTLGLTTIQSIEIPVPIGPTNYEVYVPSFTFCGLGVPAVEAPFKCAGDWTWRITHIPREGSQAAEPAFVDSGTQTRIEAYFFQGNLHWQMVELFRLVVKDLPAVNAMGLGDPVSIYAAHIARIIWNYGGPEVGVVRPALQYDHMHGAAKYGMNSGGGSFHLDAFLQRLRPVCNCYDLAGIVMVCCQALGKKPNPAIGVGVPATVPFINTRWVFINPFGYVPPGPLFGRQTQLNCNSPFWGSRLPVQWYHANGMSQQRSRFGNHAILEFLDRNAVWKVLDITHGLQVVGDHLPRHEIEDGRHDRATYLGAAINAGYLNPNPTTDVRAQNLQPGVTTLMAGGATVYPY